MIITFVSVAVIFIGFLWALGYVIKSSKSQKLIENRRWIESLPTLISTLGVLGTFLGITIGLIGFNSEDLDNSIPALLDGLKTAFFTSLAGMISSLILSKVIASYYDKNDKGVSDINIAAGIITQSVNEMRDTLIQSAQQQAGVQAAFYNNITSAITQLNQSINVQMNNSNQNLTLTTNISNQINTLEKAISSSLTGISNVVANVQTSVRELATLSESTFNVQTEISEGVKKIGPAIHAEVIEIQEAMDKTNILLEKKFNEFTELLQKSNTEALVEVMKQVTVEFQNQMNALINKLVQENFDQLNKSVERLNTWQIENKEMIKSLTEKYQQMTVSFSETSDALKAVGKDTKQLVSDGGKLSELINVLTDVIIKDEKFREVTKNLIESTEASKESNAEFSQSTKELQKWIDRQKDFAYNVQALLVQLQELRKIKDYSDEFWSSTKKGMEEGVGIIRNGSETLNKQITNLDARFYERLSVTLNNLDNCISSIAEHYLE